jgi:hypothetical protein
MNQGGKLENLKEEIQKKAVSVLGVSKVRWKGQYGIRIGDCNVHYSGSEKAGRNIEIPVYTRVLRNFVKTFCVINE